MFNKSVLMSYMGEEEDEVYDDHNSEHYLL